MKALCWTVMAAALVAGGCAEMGLPIPAQSEPPPKAEAARKAEPPPKAEARPKPPPEPRVVVAEPEPSDLDTLLTYYGQVRKLQPAELAKELETVRQAFAKDKNDLDRMRLALVQAMPGSAVRNEAGAQALLEPLLKEGSNRDSGLRAFAMLLNGYLLDNKRYEERLRDDQKQIEDLQAKIDALTSIEKSLLERGQKASVPKK